MDISNHSQIQLRSYPSKYSQIPPCKNPTPFKSQPPNSHPMYIGQFLTDNFSLNEKIICQIFTNTLHSFKYNYILLNENFLDFDEVFVLLYAIYYEADSCHVNSLFKTNSCIMNNLFRRRFQPLEIESKVIRERKLSLFLR